MKSKKRDEILTSDWELTADGIDKVLAGMLIRESKRIFSSNPNDIEEITDKVHDLVKIASREKADEAMHWLLSDDNDQKSTYIWLGESGALGREARKYEVTHFLYSGSPAIRLNISEIIFAALRDEFQYSEDSANFTKKIFSDALRELADDIDRYENPFLDN